MYTLVAAAAHSRHILPIIPLHSPIPPPVLGGAALFIPAVKHLRASYFLPDVPEGGLVTFVETVDGQSGGGPPSDPGQGRIVGVGKVAAVGGTKLAWERWAQPDPSGKDSLDLAGKFCDVLNIVGDRSVPIMALLICSLAD